jgi:hypothetical protein
VSSRTAGDRPEPERDGKPARYTRHARRAGHDRRPGGKSGNRGR